MGRYELLAPAGDCSCLIAAFNAGADAVYLAGKSFGARAYAGNFETEELIEALDYAHLFHKKIYLTLNTLIKETEISQIAEYVAPFYEHGLDGVIIQDLGLIPFMKKEFPLLELHGSTQMTVSNYRSAAWLKEQGICRVVPARELSLTELKEIKDKAHIEVEAFIHGAMCYCYSGQCLFSSFLGGRSGNRGRCAQPCRLPYKVLEDKKCISGNKEVYPLSLKDLCSIPYIYELMDAGIDSFKIEGRMKSPEYVAGVTAVYRKYMDAYEKGERKSIAKEDMEQLAHLYIRSDMKDGYFKKHNGKDMISLSSPSYQGCDDALVSKIKNTCCDTGKKQPINGVLNMSVGCEAQLTVYTDTASVTAQGDVVQEAQKRPLSKEDAIKQMEKTGNSPFEFESLIVEMDGDVFLPVKKLNELRRAALDSLQKELLQQYMRSHRNSEVNSEGVACLHGENLNWQAENPDDGASVNKQTRNMDDDACVHGSNVNKQTRDMDDGACVHGSNVNKQTRDTDDRECVHSIEDENGDEAVRLYVSVMSKGQLDAILDCDAKVDRVYLPADILFLEQVTVKMVSQMAKKREIEVYLSLPRMLRKRDEGYLEQIAQYIRRFDGVQVKSLEGLAFLKEIDYKGNLVTDYSLYNWNTSSQAFLNSYRTGFAYPLELSVAENQKLNDRRGEYIVYGRTPMMITANCVRKTMSCCQAADGNNFAQSLQDRYRKELPVYTNCVHCYNEIFNAVPMSLHKEISQLIKRGFSLFRLDFSDETVKQTKKIVEYYTNKLNDPGYAADFVLKEYTQGHYKEGAI